jgi:hypothetical protein
MRQPAASARRNVENVPTQVDPEVGSGYEGDIRRHDLSCTGSSCTPAQTHLRSNPPATVAVQ